MYYYTLASQTLYLIKGSQKKSLQIYITSLSNTKLMVNRIWLGMRQKDFRN